MVQTITPVVNGGRRARWMGSVAAHTLGTTLAAAALGAMLGGIGAAAGAPWGRTGAVVVAGVAFVYAARELVRIPVPLPNLHRQVPQWWRTFFSPRATSFLYGLGLGVGFITYLSFGTLVACGAVAVAAGSPLAGLTVVAPFGFARGLSILVARDATTAEGVSRAVDRLDALAVSSWPRIVNGLVLVAVTAAAVLAAAGAPGRSASGAAGWILAAVFAWSTVSKVIAPARWRRALDGYALPRWLRAPALLGVPVAELAVAALATWGLVTASAWVTLALLAAFTAAIVRARMLGGDRLACGCFGGRRTLDYRVMLGRNAGLALVAVAALAAPTGGGIRALGVPHGGQIVAAVLAVAGLVLLGVVARTIAATWTPR